MTNLPCSEEAYEVGAMETGLTLAEAMTPEGAAKVSPYAGVVLMACLFGHIWLHQHRLGPNDRPEDLHGEFWKRHNNIDSILSNTAMFFPENLRLPAGFRDPNVVDLNLNIHSSIICLHQTAIMMMEKHSLEPQIATRSTLRCRMAAEEIVNIVRHISHFELAEVGVLVFKFQKLTFSR